MYRRFKEAYRFKLFAPDTGGGIGGGGSTGGQVPPGGTGAQDAPQDPPAPGAPGAPPPAGQEGSGDEAWDPARARATIEKLREFEKDAKAKLKRLDDLETQAKADADKKELEKGNYQKLLADREAELATERANNRALVLQVEAASVAQKLNIEKPHVALRLIDPGAIQYDSLTGKPTNLEALFKAAIEELPALVNTGASVPGSPNRPPPAGSSTPNSVQAYHDQMYKTPAAAAKN